MLCAMKFVPKPMEQRDVGILLDELWPNAVHLTMKIKRRVLPPANRNSDTENTYSPKIIDRSFHVGTNT